MQQRIKVDVTSFLSKFHTNTIYVLFYRYGLRISLSHKSN